MFKYNFLLYRLFVNVIALGFASIFFKHIEIDSFLTLFLSAIIFTFLNIFLKPALLLLTLPLQIISFGLFYIIISAFILQLTSYLMDGFVVDGFWAAIGGSLVIGVINLIFDLFAKNADIGGTPQNRKFWGAN